MGHHEDEPARVAVVLSGAAARGAFQAGALAEVLTWFEAEQLRPALVLGTSAGSINSVLYGSWAHLGPAGAAERLEELWGRVGHRDVYAPLLASLPGTVAAFDKGFLLGRGSGTTSLLDTAPLRRTAEAELDTESLGRNINDGLVDAVGVVATRVPAGAADTVQGAGSGRSVLFLHSRTAVTYAGDPDRAQDVVLCPLGVEHVLASAAIPVAFPAQRIEHPPEAAGWYVDGGVRLNTPLRPAIRLGATHLVVISATATRHAPALPPECVPETPDVADSTAQLIHAVLADRMIEDLHAVQRANGFVRQFTSDGLRPPVRPDGTEYRPIAYLPVSPEPGQLARLAEEVLRARTSGLRGARDLDLVLIGRLVRGAGDGTGRRELLSYLLFDQEYFRASLELGRAAARRALAAGWQH